MHRPAGSSAERASSDICGRIRSAGCFPPARNFTTNAQPAKNDAGCRSVNEHRRLLRMMALLKDESQPRCQQCNSNECITAQGSARVRIPPRAFRYAGQKIGRWPLPKARSGAVVWAIYSYVNVTEAGVYTRSRPDGGVPDVSERSLTKLRICGRLRLRTQSSVARSFRLAQLNRSRFWSRFLGSVRPSKVYRAWRVGLGSRPAAHSTGPCELRPRRCTRDLAWFRRTRVDCGEEKLRREPWTSG